MLRTFTVRRSVHTYSSPPTYVNQTGTRWAPPFGRTVASQRFPSFDNFLRAAADGAGREAPGELSRRALAIDQARIPTVV
jgi:hypothetical protein